MIIKNDNNDVTFKIIFAGPHNAGKSMFLWRLTGSDITFDEKSTIGANFVRYEETIDEQRYKAHLWDTAGQEAFHSITAPYFRSCTGVLLLFDLSDRESFNKLDYWVQMITENTKTLPIIFLVANKCDLNPFACEEEEIREFCSKHSFHYFYSSALTGENVQNIMTNLMKEIISKNYEIRRTIPEIVRPKVVQEQESSCC